MHHPYLLFFVATFAVSPICQAASESAPRIAYAATQPGPSGPLSEAVHFGSFRADVIAKIGLPGTQLSPDVWVYWNKYRCDEPSAARLGCDTLIVVFANDRVTHMKLVNAQTLTAELTRPSNARFAGNAPAPR
jgi:hypothetical protein